MRRALVLAIVVPSVAACDRESRTDVPSGIPDRPSTAPVTFETAIDVSDGLSGPEAIIHDTAGDVYLVSNMNGGPHVEDDNGFISRVSPDGTVVARTWIDGARPDITLHAPRGMAIDGDRLYVVDLDAVRVFDRKTGAPLASWPVPDPHFPNDIRVARDGGVLVTETAIHLDPSGTPIPEGTSTIWHYDHEGHPTQLVAGPQLAGPNGIASTRDGLVVASFLGHEVYRIVDGTQVTLATLPATQLDGLVQLPDDSFIVTSWVPRAVWRVFPDGSFRREMGDSSFVGAASVEYDRTRGRLLIPLVLANMLRFEPYELPRPQAPVPRG